MAEHNEQGAAGEKLTADYLTNKGYLILEKNWQFKHAEVDIIARQDTMLVIVEVKTRKSNYFGEPEEFVTKQKQKLLIQSANAYIEKKQLELEVRFDIVSVILSNGKYTIHHIEDAFHPIA